MSAPGHAPGPWRIESGPYYRAIRVDSEVIADMRQIGRSFNESNARLIAAAPELLEALEMVMRRGRIDDSEEAMNHVAAAINKAKGLK